MKRKGQVKFVPKEKTALFSTLKERVDAYFDQNHLSKNDEIIAIQRWQYAEAGISKL